MITSIDSFSTIDLGSYYAILPSNQSLALSSYSEFNTAKKVVEGFAYNSGTNPNFLTIEELRILISKNIDPEFEPF